MKKTALVVVDMVYDFAHPDGLVYYPQNGEILPRIAALVRGCRPLGALIVFVRHSHRAGKYDKELAMVRKNCIAGTGGDELMPELGYCEATDYQVVKRRYSAFFGTDLDLILRENGVQNVVVCGTKTNCCVRSTVNDAYMLGYDVVVPGDCVGTNDETVNRVHLADIAKYFGRVMTAGELLERLRKGEL